MIVSQVKKKKKETSMDDHLKIQVLMIYYKHWGNEQNEIRKMMDGVQQFQKIYDEHGFMMRMSCRSYLKRHKRRTMYHMIDLLLGRCGGGFQPMEMLPESKDRIGMLMNHTLKQSKIVGDDTYWNMLGIDFSETEALSVEAIVALM